MTNLTTEITWNVGVEYAGRSRYVSLDRILWYEDGILSSTLGKGGPPRKNHHTDEAYAKEQGLPAAIADGMLSTNWISELLLDLFGEAYVSNGYLRTKFIKPTFLGVRIVPHLKVTAVEDTENGRVISMEVWTDDPDGILLTVGEAKITVGSSL